MQDKFLTTERIKVSCTTCKKRWTICAPTIGSIWLERIFEWWPDFEIISLAMATTACTKCQIIWH